MYADKVTDSIRTAMDETARRRELQRAFNEAHDITPRTVTKGITDLTAALGEGDWSSTAISEGGPGDLMDKLEVARLIRETTKSMNEAAMKLEFEEAAKFRDTLKTLQQMEIGTLPAFRSRLLAGGGESEAPKRRRKSKYRRR